ncbi:hypothetical protein NPA11_00425 [Mycoplasma sp. 1578d]|uniref:hypothetical protein n=1 Tax=Mycoplasma sp. 1578d TaxID=2967299 RepID=UPI00211D0DCE|nr:hypothetical protein [Mycoplasma sp. 1578d]UUM19893.1 hypothetical protein NPA11_00425 [Mycoplasma sp. 1578d]
MNISQKLKKAKILSIINTIFYFVNFILFIFFVVVYVKIQTEIWNYLETRSGLETGLDNEEYPLIFEAMLYYIIPGIFIFILGLISLVLRIIIMFNIYDIKSSFFQNDFFEYEKYNKLLILGIISIFVPFISIALYIMVISNANKEATKLNNLNKSTQ